MYLFAFLVDTGRVCEMGSALRLAGLKPVPLNTKGPPASFCAAVLSNLKKESFKHLQNHSVFKIRVGVMAICVFVTSSFQITRYLII